MITISVVICSDKEVVSEGEAVLGRKAVCDFLSLNKTLRRRGEPVEKKTRKLSKYR